MYRTQYCETTKIWSGNKRLPLYNSNISVGQVLLEKLAYTPNKLATINDNNGIILTNNELRLNAIRAALHLIELKCKVNDTICIISSNNHNLLSIYIAAMLIGMPINSIDTSTDCDNLIRPFEIVKPKLIFCEHNNYNNVKKAINQLNLNIQIILFDGNIDGIKRIEDFFQATGTEDEFIPPIINGMELPAIISMTSGTTGTSKFASLSHATILTVTGKIYSSITVDSVCFSFATMSWQGGVINIFSGLLNGATCILTTENFSPKLMFEIIENYKVTHLLSVPAQLSELAQNDAIKCANLSSVKMYVCGGAKVFESFMKKFQFYIPNGKIYIAYGSSELGGAMTMLCFERDTDAKSVGPVIDGISMKIIDSNGNSLGVNKSGEICIKSMYPFLGYYNNEELTKRTLNSDNWLHTNDMGYFNEDGHLFLRERKTDLLKSDENEIAPSQIEDILLKNFNINTTIVFGIPDGNNDNDLIAAAFLKSNQLDINENDINKVLKENISESLCLKGGIYFFDKFPKTNSGKILRREIKRTAINLYKCKN